MSVLYYILYTEYSLMMYNIQFILCIELWYDIYIYILFLVLCINVNIFSRWWQLKYFTKCSPRKFGEDEPILTNSYFFRWVETQPPTSFVTCFNKQILMKAHESARWKPRSGPWKDATTVSENGWCRGRCVLGMSHGDQKDSQDLLLYFKYPREI